MQANIVVHPGKAATGMPDPQNFNIQMRLSQQYSVRRRGSNPIPGSFFKVGAKNDRRGGLCRALTTNQQENRRRVFQDTLKAEPDGERNPVNRLPGKIAEIESNGAESASLKQEIRTAQNLVEIPAPDPEQTPHVDAGRRSRFRIERIRPIH
jgi:hypothetical protein